MTLLRILVIIAMAFVATLTVAAVDLLFAPVEDADAPPQAEIADLYDPGMRGVMQRIGLLPTRHELRRELGVEGDGDGAVDVAAAQPAGGMAGPDGAGSRAPTAAAPPGSAIAAPPAAADAGARRTEAAEPAIVPDPGGTAAQEEPAAGVAPDALPAPREIAGTAAAEPGDAASPADTPTASHEESPPTASATVSLEELAAEVGIDPDAVIPPDVIDGTAVPLLPDGSGDVAASLPPAAETPPVAAVPAGRDRDSDAADADADATISLEELAAEVGIDPDTVVPPEVIDGTAVPLMPDGSGDADASLPPAAETPPATAAPGGRDQDSAAAAAGTISLEELATEAGIDPDAVEPPFDDAALLQSDAAAAPTAQPGDAVPAEISGVAADPDAGRGEPATGAAEATSDAGDAAPEPAESGDASTAVAEEDSIDPFEIAAVDPGDTAATGPATSPADQAATGAPSLAVTPDGAAAADPLAPTYDTIRFERSGDGLIAGHAAPNAKIELFAGDDLVGQTDSGANGDWLIVLDRPLAPGDHRLTVRATRPGASVLTGAQAIALTIDGGAEPSFELVEPAPSASN